ncbi:hypothetical protein LTS07_008321 [Exophiala sideris]|uniref:Uncharacterized protein n=1 Tax=Exophiala sideris TaxID=1016849 RepID=A0ABR0J2L5_9EURO|nr:hypothetical protein LTS07_008321 [Exophiala sideris]KAK5031468.1 hypothetical protein LTR13_007796 [Exophiala sideris]KAK5054981.1 hypothetical protein LTR69_008549 [Exophiala sideris]KAK5179862.1 hypothetical protein LTR44_007678 [Eurotiomycetes sp. CCFEE 6388]
MTIYDEVWIPTSMQYYQQSKESFSFSSMSQARHPLTVLLLRLMEIKRLEMRQVACDVSQGSMLRKRKSVLVGLDQWSTAFESFLDSDTRKTKDDVRAGHLLLIQHLAGFIHLSVTASDAETSYDKYLPKFQKIVFLSRILLDPMETLHSVRPKVKKYRYEHGIIPSLYLVGYKCRDPIVRREAHRQLASLNTKEGVWDSDLMVKVVGHIIAVEGCDDVVCSSSDVSEEARVWREYLHAEEGSKDSKIVFEHRLSGGNATRLIERSLD